MPIPPNRLEIVSRFFHLHGDGSVLRCIVVHQVDIDSTNFEIHLRCDTVTQVHLDSPGAETVLLGIDESGGDLALGDLRRVCGYAGCGVVPG